MPVRRWVLVAGAVAVTMGAAACGGATPGQPVAAGSGPTTSSPPSSEVDSLPVTRACSLVSAGDLRQLGVSSQPTQEMVGTAHACDFNSPTLAMGFGIRTNQGLATFTSAGGVVHDTVIGRHQAKQEVDNTGSCVIGIGVSASSRVDVTVTGDGTTNPCPTALTLARMVERRLP